MRLRALTLLLLPFALAARAQETPAANPGRPTVTNPATLPPVGYLQFENGYLGSLTSPETQAQYGVNQVTKLAVHPRLMALAEFQPWATSRAVGDTGFTNGSGDILIGAQAVLFSPTTANSPDPTTQAQKKTPIPTIALGYLGRVHSGTTGDIDLGGAKHSLILLLSGDIHGFHYDTNYLLNEQTDGPIRRAQTAQTLSVNHSLWNDNLQLSVEIYHFTQPLVHTTVTGAPTTHAHLVDLLIAPTYQLRPNLVLDAGFTRGFTNTSTRWQSFTGFTYLLPHRLWPEHKPKG